MRIDVDEFWDKLDGKIVDASSVFKAVEECYHYNNEADLIYSSLDNSYTCNCCKNKTKERTTYCCKCGCKFT